MAEGLWLDEPSFAEGLRVRWKNLGFFGLSVMSVSMKFGAQWKLYESLRALASCRIMSCYYQDVLHRADTFYQPRMHTDGTRI